MMVASTMFLLLAGSALQSLFPAVAWLGYSTVPVLAALVVYFALFRRAAATFAFAILAGMFQDSLSLIPLGYSSFTFSLGALLIFKYRELMLVQSGLTHMLLTAALHALSTLLLMILLLKDGLIYWQSLMLLKIPGAIVLGLLAGPVVVAATRALEEKLGLIQGNSDHYGSYRSHYGIG
ncbi:MAG TPA: hypothetical protein PJ991_10350 [Kiritimatiellia bacterium]|nr:hypothetical protein [Kiritimatiellia bacterium]